MSGTGSPQTYRSVSNAENTMLSLRGVKINDIQGYNEVNLGISKTVLPMIMTMVYD